MNSIEMKKSKSYDKTLVVGHTLSEYESIMDLLTASGMNLAKTLKKELIPATEISTTLLKMHSTDSEDIEQLEINQVWDGLALDLLMSNIDQNWWGWADSNAISLLNYWKSVDTKIVFVLVYDTPQNFIKRTLNAQESISKESLSTAINEWIKYNTALLKFYYKNNECALLVNTQQVKVDTTKYLEQVNNQLGMIDADIKTSTIAIAEKTFKRDMNDDLLFDYVIKDLLHGYPEMLNLFEELQSVANLAYLNKEEIKQNSLEVMTSLFTQQKASKENNKKINTLTNKLEFLEKQYKDENELLLTQLMQVQENLEESYINNKEKNKEITNLRTQKEFSEKKYKEESDLHLTQLTEVQKSLVESHKDNKKKSEEVTNLTRKLKSSEKEHKDENELLLSQLMSVQEELESYYLENKKLKQRIKESIKAKHYGAGERIKQQLSYRLGAVMINHSHSFGGFIRMPFALVKEQKKFKSELKKKIKLPAIETYADAYDAERLKKHLSYRLGQTMIESSKSTFGFLKLPWRLRRAYVDYVKGKNNV